MGFVLRLFIGAFVGVLIVGLAHAAHHPQS